MAFDESLKRRDIIGRGILAMRDARDNLNVGPPSPGFLRVEQRPDRRPVGRETVAALDQVREVMLIWSTQGQRAAEVPDE